MKKYYIMGLRDDYRYNNINLNENNIFWDNSSVYFVNPTTKKKMNLICSTYGYVKEPFKNILNDFKETMGYEQCTLTEVVTKKQFINHYSVSIFHKDFESGSYQLGEYLKIKKEVTSDEVVDFLKGLTEEDYKVYTHGLHYLETQMIKDRREQYYAKKEEEKKIKQKQRDNDDFINRFGR